MNEPWWRTLSVKFEAFIAEADKRGYVTHEDLNDVLPGDVADPDTIEDILTMLQERGIDVVESNATDE